MKSAPGAPLAEAQRRLAAFGEARQYLGCLLGARPEDRALWEKVLSLSRRALARTPNQARALLLKGRALSYLGRGSEGLPSFDRALLLEPGASLGWAWRGEAHLLAGERKRRRRISIAPSATALGRGRGSCARRRTDVGDCPAAEAVVPLWGPEAAGGRAIWALYFGQQRRRPAGSSLDAADRKPRG